MDDRDRERACRGLWRYEPATVTLAGSGLVLIDVRVSSFDDIQRYDNERGFIASL